jgi:hypothetical protein
MKSLKYVIAICVGLSAALMVVGNARADSSEILSSCVTLLREMRVTPEIPPSGYPCWYFMSGIKDVITIGDSTTNRAMLQVCAPVDSTLLQLIRIFVLYAQQNPTRLDLPAGEVAIEALWQAYPCNYQ